jgi:hypothetical protein
MTAPVIALTQAEAEAIARANAALSWIRADTFPWPAQGSEEIRLHADGLRGALDDYADLTASRTHPATLFPDLSDERDDAMAVALDRVTEDIRAWTGALCGLASAAEEAFRAREEGRAA